MANDVSHLMLLFLK